MKSPYTLIWSFRNSLEFIQLLTDRVSDFVHPVLPIFSAFRIFTVTLLSRSGGGPLQNFENRYPSALTYNMYRLKGEFAFVNSSLNKIFAMGQKSDALV